MKTTCLAIRGLGVGAVALGVFASATVSHAAILINDLTAPTAGEAGVVAGPYLSQDFSTPVPGPMLGVTLDLNFSAAAVTAGTPLDVFVYHATASGPTGPLAFFGLLGTVTPTVAGANDYAVNIIPGHNFALTPGQDYAILFDTTLASGTVAWEYSTSANAAAANTAHAGQGAFLSGYTAPDGSTWTATSGDAFQVQVVPEPATTAFIGFGALALLAIQRMRSKQD
jgi:hypothetical protein